MKATKENEYVPKSYTLETKRFLLRIPNIQDIPHIFSATRFAGFNDGMLWEPPQQIEALTKPLENSIKAWESGEAYSFTIVEKNADIPDLLGRISIRKTDQPTEWDVGFWTHPMHQGRGVMTEALGAVLKFGFEVLAASRIQACYATWNKASEKVLQRNGFTFERHIPQGFKKRGEWVAENLLSITRK